MKRELVALLFFGLGFVYCLTLFAFRFGDIVRLCFVTVIISAHLFLLLIFIRTSIIRRYILK